MEDLAVGTTVESLEPVLSSSASGENVGSRRRIYGTFMLDEDDEQHDQEAAGLLKHNVPPGITWQTAIYTCLGELIIHTSAVAVAVFITIIDNLPYGLLLFPPAFNLGPLGVQLVLVSAVVSQAVFGAMSTFSCALGSFIIENVAFLRAMSTSLSSQLHDQGRTEEALTTILFCFSFSSLLTGAAFYVLGVLKLGKISSFVPQHVVLGCIGGMGVFIVCEGIGITTGIDWSWEPAVLLAQMHPSPLLKILVTGALTVGLSALKQKITHPILTPLFFVAIPLAFYAVLPICGVSVAEARASGWLFSFSTPVGDKGGDSAAAGVHALPGEGGIGGGGGAEGGMPSSLGIAKECRSFPGVLACLDFRLIAWELVPTQLFTMVGLVFFSLIHVPVNVPALAATTGVEADLNKELRAHGVANLLCGLSGALQTYMAYSTSALYYKTGGGGRFSSFLITVLMASFLLMGPKAINYFPRPLAGSLLLHLGAVLLYESVVSTWQKSVDWSEYVTIWTITLSMTLIGFMEGVGIGLLLACGIFVVQCSGNNPIGSAFSGDGLSSKEMRSPAQRKLLEYRLQGSIYIIRLRGNLFFGNIEQLFLHLREVLHCMPHLLFLVLDTGELAGIDFSARDRLAKMCRSMTGEGGREGGKRGGRKVHLVWAGLHKSVKEKLRAGKCFGEEDGTGKGGKIQAALAVKGPGRRGGGSGRGEGWGWASLARGKQMHHFARDLNKAFTFCEDTILAAVGALDEEEEESEEERKTAQGPGLRPGGKRDGDTKVGIPSPPVSFAGGGAPTGREFLHRTLRKLARRATEAVDEGMLARLLSSFTQESLPARATLWRRNDPSTFACIVQKGVLGVPRLKEDPSVSASLAQAPGCLLSGTLPPSSPSSSLPSTRLKAGTRFRANSHSDVADDEEEDVRTRYTHPSYPDLVSLASTVGGKPGHFREYSLPGQMCGELGLFTRGLRKYTMVAITEAVIWRLDAGRLKKMRVEDPQAYIVMQGIVLSYASHRLNCLMLQGQLHSV